MRLCLPAAATLLLLLVHMDAKTCQALQDEYQPLQQACARHRALASRSHLHCSGASSAGAACAATASSSCCCRSWRHSWKRWRALSAKAKMQVLGEVKRFAAVQSLLQVLAAQLEAVAGTVCTVRREGKIGRLAQAKPQLLCLLLVTAGQPIALPPTTLPGQPTAPHPPTRVAGCDGPQAQLQQEGGSAALARHAIHLA